ncbi:MFS transporter [Terricaulis sp.]|uniref:MFS transporter n=1 Tax=Terricaulis sp. TaxID=2768686 RepID=UPI0037832D19
MSTDNATGHRSGFPFGNWLIALLFAVCYIFSYADRQVLSILVKPIKESLNLSDTQIGLMQGVSFSLFYVAASLPLAWLADRVSRSKVISGCVAVWSIFSMSCGFATSFAQLLSLRIGLAMTEAGLTPAALALLAARFDPRRLATATSMFMLAPFIGGGLAIAGGGLLLGAVERSHAAGHPMFGALEPWRMVFLLVGAPGLVIALLVLLIRERKDTVTKAAKLEGEGLRDLLQYLVREWRIFVLYGLAMGLTMTVLSGYITWLPEAIRRAENLTAAEVGVAFGPIYLVAGSAGTLMAGVFVMTRSGGDPVRTILTTMLVVNFLLWPFATFGLTLPGLSTKLALMGATIFLISCVTSLSSLPYQHLTPHAMRSQALALLAMVSALLGTGLGPVLAGVMSDQITFTAQPLSFALSLIAGVAIPLVQVLLFMVLRRHLQTRLDQHVAAAAPTPAAVAGERALA